MSNEKFFKSEGILVTDASGNKYLLYPLKPYSDNTEDLLSSFGFRHSVPGFKYVITAVEILQKEPDCVNAFCMYLFPKVAKIHGVSPASVERAIRYMLNNHCPTEEFYKVFGNVEKVTVKELIMEIVEILNPGYTKGKIVLY